MRLVIGSGMGIFTVIFMYTALGHHVHDHSTVKAGLETASPSGCYACWWARVLVEG